MPTYDYNCKSCGHSFEARQNIKEKPLEACPKCQKNDLERGFGGGNTLLSFKGTGFYQTDYKKNEIGSSCGCKGSHSCKK